MKQDKKKLTRFLNKHRNILVLLSLLLSAGIVYLFIPRIEYFVCNEEVTIGYDNFDMYYGKKHVRMYRFNKTNLTIIPQDMIPNVEKIKCLQTETELDCVNDKDSESGEYQSIKINRLTMDISHYYQYKTKIESDDYAEQLFNNSGYINHMYESNGQCEIKDSQF